MIARLLTERDIYHFREGTHFRAYEKLGAHPLVMDERERRQMRALTSLSGRRTQRACRSSAISTAGIRARIRSTRRPTIPASGRASCPGVGAGALYKYHIVSRHNGDTVEKADPFAFARRRRRAPPRCVWDLDYDWSDGEWMSERGERNALDAPMSIYEVHLGSWRRVPEEGNRSLTIASSRTRSATM